jgi:transposase
MNKRRKYTREFKIEAIRLLTDEGYTLRKAAESLGVSQNSLSTWKKQLQDEADSARLGDRPVVSRDEEIKKLQQENRRLRMERDILKKATAFFANDQR